MSKNPLQTRKPSWLTTNIIVAYTLPVVKEAIPSSNREAKISSESKMYKDTMMEDEFSIQK